MENYKHITWAQASAKCVRCGGSIYANSDYIDGHYHSALNGYLCNDCEKIVPLKEKEPDIYKLLNIIFKERNKLTIQEKCIKVLNKIKDV